MLGFKKFKKEYYRKQSLENDVIEKYFRYSIFYENVLHTIPTMLMESLLSNYFQFWTQNAIVSVSIQVFSLFFQ